MMETIKTPQEIADREAQLSAYAGEDRVVLSTDMRKEIAARPRNQVKIMSGIPGLDRLIDGFEGGELIVVSGVSKHGKTLLCQTLTANFQDQGMKSLWFSFEVPIRQFLSQIPEKYEFILPRVLVPASTTWLDDRIVEAKLKWNCRVVFIDHLHYLIDLEKGGRNISIDIGAVVRGLKRCAIKHNVIIFLLCHATKALTETGKERELGMMDLRDSSFIPQEADSVFIIRRIPIEPKFKGAPPDYSNQAMLKVCCHRRTGTMEKRIVLVKTGQLFEELVSVTEEAARLEADSITEDSYIPEDKHDDLPF